MAAGVSKELPEYQDADDEYGPFAGAFLKGIAPTTSRRVGRSTKKPPGPATDDGMSGTSTGSDDATEHPATAVIETIRESLRSPDGRTRLAQALEMPAAHMLQRTDKAQRLGQVFSQLRSEGLFETRIFAAGRGQPIKIILGYESVFVTLDDTQRSTWCGLGRNRAIIVASHLPEETVKHEVIKALANEISIIAAENGMLCPLDEMVALLLTLAKNDGAAHMPNIS